MLKGGLIKLNIIKMIDKFNNSPKGRLISSFFVLFFSIVMVVTAVYAWFANNAHVNSTGMGISSEVESGFTFFTPFYVSDIDTQTVSMGNQVDTRVFRDLNINLRPYDVTFTSTNVYTPVVIRMTVYELEQKYIPTGNETKQFNIDIPRDTTLDNGTSSTLAGIFSSIGHIGFYHSTTLALNATNQTIYNTIVAQYRADNSQYKYTTVTNNVITKTNTINFNVTYSANDFKTDSYGKSCLTLYMVFDYRPELAQLYATQNSGALGSLGLLSQSYTIANDLTRLAVTFPIS